jgi:hypothetical protein
MSRTKDQWLQETGGFPLKGLLFAKLWLHYLLFGGRMPKRLMSDFVIRGFKPATNREMIRFLRVPCVLGGSVFAD